MQNSIYIALSRQVAAERQLNLLANNMANANTVGFKSSNMMFSEYMVNNNNKKTSFVLDYGTVLDSTQGPLSATGSPFDLAIQGKGYFAIQTAAGERYTRAGNFTKNDQGQLATLNGDLVLDNAGQPIEFEPQDTRIVVYGDGRLEVDGQERAQIGVYEFTNESKLIPVANNMFKSDEAPVLSEEAKIAQGMLEQSNVKPILEITKLIDMQRDFTSAAKFINDTFDLQDRAIQTIGRDN